MMIDYFVASGWSSVDKRKRFFEQYAEVNNFDPTIPENWYSQDRADILSLKVILYISFLFSSLSECFVANLRK